MNYSQASKKLKSGDTVRRVSIPRFRTPIFFPPKKSILQVKLNPQLLNPQLKANKFSDLHSSAGISSLASLSAASHPGTLTSSPTTPGLLWMPVAGPSPGRRPWPARRSARRANRACRPSRRLRDFKPGWGKQEFRSASQVHSQKFLGLVKGHEKPKVVPFPGSDRKKHHNHHFLFCAQCPFTSNY